MGKKKKTKLGAIIGGKFLGPGGALLGAGRANLPPFSNDGFGGGGGGEAGSFQQIPAFQSNQFAQRGTEHLFDLGSRLTQLDLGGQLSGLQPLLNFEPQELDPESTRLALQFAQQSLTPGFQDTIKNIRNEAAKAGALESSTFTDALSEEAGRLNSQFQAITTGAALQDRAFARQANINERNRVLSSTLGLFQTGLGLTGQATQFGFAQQGAENAFGAQRTQLNNEIMLAQRGLEPKRGGLGGALSGAIGGGTLGATIGGPYGAIIGAGAGGLIGGLAPQGTGGQLAQIGGSFGGFDGAGGTAGAGQRLLGRGAGSPGRQFGFDPQFSGLQRF